MQSFPDVRIENSGCQNNVALAFVPLSGLVELFQGFLAFLGNVLLYNFWAPVPYLLVMV